MSTVARVRTSEERLAALGERMRPPSPPRPGRAAGHRPGRRGALVLLGAVMLVVFVVLVRTALAHLFPSGPQPVDPSRFAAGSCVAYPPTQGDRGRTVFLDAGHGGLDPGAVGRTESGATVTEAGQTLPVELDTMALLRADGYRVVVSRTTDNTVLRLGPQDVSGSSLSLLGSHEDVAARDQCADLSGADVLLGIYLDASPSASTGGSLTTYDGSRSFADRSHRLADLVQRDILAAMNARGWAIPDQGVMDDAGLGSWIGQPGSSLAEKAAHYHHVMLLGPAEPGYFSTPSRMPGALTEPLYVTDPFEGSIAASTRGQEVIAAGLAQAVEQYFGS